MTDPSLGLAATEGNKGLPSLASTRKQTETLAAKLEAAFIPTDEQQAALKGLVAFARGSSNGNFATLTGPAGTGKSTIMRLARDEIQAAGFSVGLAAPTHKACHVLAAACGVAKTDTCTFASLLALREKKVKDTIKFVRDWRRKPRIDEHDVWLCDEASMLEPQMLELIAKEADFWDRFIFVGDPAQLPPVSHGKVSPALRCSPCLELSSVWRHGGPILDAATTIRQTASDHWRVAFTESRIDDKSAIYAYPDKRQWQQAILEMAAEHHDSNDPDALRVLCFRRAEVAKLNTAIRRSVYGRDADPYLAGERLITVEAVKDPFDAEGFPLYGSSRELVVQQATTGELLHPTCSDGKPFLCWHLTVLADGPEEFPKRITVIDPRHEGKLAVALTDLKAEAKEHPDAQGAWDPYWELRDTFAEVQPHWAMTVHKSQGSQFRHVFISPDLDTAPRAKSMRRHLWYTALTRAQQAVHLIADTEIQA